ncbi:DnaJ subfamily C member 21 [Balamuthia mandrillaris]
MMSGGGQATMRCYYEVLEVERNASADELKKAYRKKALLWHPDRNIHQPELAHERFQELQQAYDVLSDPHERAWYDDHREAILRGGDGTAEDGAEHGINLWPFFNNSCFSGYNDGPKGFYTVYGGLFAKLAEEEEEAAANKKQKNGSPAAPAFGDLFTPYPAVKEFYNHWLNFVTQKNFAWCDQYKTTEAPNRQIRRLMEKENKKCRDKERRLFNEQVRHLVEHVRKKDKRVIEHLIKTKQETEQKREKELLRKKQQEEERQAARELQEAEELQHLENFQEEWDKLGLDDIYSPEELSRGKKNKKGKGKGKDVQAAADAVDAKHMDGEAELFCPACKKSFKSERSYQNHEKSKKHLANVKKLERELLEAALAAEDEDEEAEEEEDEGAKGEEDMQKHGNDSEHSEEFVVLGDADSSSEKEQREADGQESEDDEEEEWEMLLRYQQQSRRFSTGSQDEDEEEEEAKNEEDEGSADTDVTSNTNEAKEQEENESAPESSAKENGLDEGEEEEVEAKITKETAKPFTKKERRMLRKMRKKDSRAATNSSPAPSSSSSSEDNALRCKTCSVTFRSRNKLFQHIKQTGHAAFKK